MRKSHQTSMGAMVEIEVTQADYQNSRHARELVRLLEAYALDPMGGGHGLSEFAKDNVVENLARLPDAFSVLAFSAGQAVGLVNCFVGFSTFLCRPLVNIHDLVVLEEFRGRGIGRLMMTYVERLARERGCCKLTLEVLEGNRDAQTLYRNLGFAGYQLDSKNGHAMFWQKSLES